MKWLTLLWVRYEKCYPVRIQNVLMIYFFIILSISINNYWLIVDFLPLQPKTSVSSKSKDNVDDWECSDVVAWMSLLSLSKEYPQLKEEEEWGSEKVKKERMIWLKKLLWPHFWEPREWQSIKEYDKGWLEGYWSDGVWRSQALVTGGFFNQVIFLFLLFFIIIVYIQYKFIYKSFWNHTNINKYITWIQNNFIEWCN